jgi:hypothetical protein
MGKIIEMAGKRCGSGNLYGPGFFWPQNHLQKIAKNESN